MSTTHSNTSSPLLRSEHRDSGELSGHDFVDKDDGEDTMNLGLDVVLLGDLFPDNADDSDNEDTDTGLVNILAPALSGSRVYMCDPSEYMPSLIYDGPMVELVEMARDFLSKLLSDRSDGKDCQRPIVFVGMGLGGIVVKQTILLTHVMDEFQPIRDCIKGVVFVGTPHKEDEEHDYTRVIAKSVKRSRTGDPAADVLEHLKCLHIKITHLRELTTYFCDIAGTLPIYTITRPDLQVSQTSATLGSRGEVHVELEITRAQQYEPEQIGLGILQCIKEIGRQSRPSPPAVYWNHQPQSPYSVDVLPPICCPVCSSLPQSVPLGPDTLPLEYPVPLNQRARDDLRLWVTRCEVASFAYHLGSYWLRVEDYINGQDYSMPFNRGRSVCIANPEYKKQLRWREPRQYLCLFYSVAHWAEANVYYEPGCIFSSEHDVPFHNDVKSFVVHQDPLSERTLRHMQSWIEPCNDQHDCYQPTCDFLPTRLLDVRNLNRITLCDSVHLQGQLDSGGVRYATLSHCWGTSREFLTTKDTLPQRRQGFPIFEALPKTFSDAILTTNKLGIPYLWIDSICIIQDDVADWALEASRMADVYKNSYLTIAAASSDSDEKGFLQPRPFAYATLQFTSPGQNAVLAYLSREKLQEDSYHVPYYPLLRRAWVFQEQYLSRRSLIFSHEEIFFYCKGLSRCASESKGLSSYKSLTKGFSLGLSSRWQDIIQEISNRLLTYDSDKLPSIAGVASTLSTTEDGSRRQYCAGIWRDDLTRHLLFKLSRHEVRSPQKYIAPSWSWAALNGPIRWLEDEFSQFDEPLSCLHSARIMDCNIALRDERSPYGEVMEGSSLTLQAQFIELLPCPQTPVDMTGSGTETRHLESREELPHASGNPPETYNVGQIIMGQSYRFTWEGHEMTVWCSFDIPSSRPPMGETVLIGLLIASPGWFPRTFDSNGNIDNIVSFRRIGPIVGLLVSPMGGESSFSDGYKRVGIFAMPTSTKEYKHEPADILRSIPSRTVVLY